MGAANLQVGFNYNAANIQLDSSAESACSNNFSRKKEIPHHDHDRWTTTSSQCLYNLKSSTCTQILLFKSALW
jgi:hypothetical protein